LLIIYEDIPAHETKSWILARNDFKGLKLYNKIKNLVGEILNRCFVVQDGLHLLSQHKRWFHYEGILLLFIVSTEHHHWLVVWLQLTAKASLEVSLSGQSFQKMK